MAEMSHDGISEDLPEDARALIEGVCAAAKVTFADLSAHIRSHPAQKALGIVYVLLYAETTLTDDDISAAFKKQTINVTTVRAKFADAYTRRLRHRQAEIRLFKRICENFGLSPDEVIEENL